MCVVGAEPCPAGMVQALLVPRRQVEDVFWWPEEERTDSTDSARNSVGEIICLSCGNCDKWEARSAHVPTAGNRANKCVCAVTRQQKLGPSGGGGSGG
jgi:hypothetical protein